MLYQRFLFIETVPWMDLGSVKVMQRGIDVRGFRSTGLAINHSLAVLQKNKQTKNAPSARGITK